MAGETGELDEPRDSVLRSHPVEHGLRDLVGPRELPDVVDHVSLGGRQARQIRAVAHRDDGGVAHLRLAGRGGVRRPHVGAVLLARRGDDGQLLRLELHLGLEAQIRAHVEVAPAVGRAVQERAEGPAHAAAALGDRVEDLPMRLWDLIAPRNLRDAWRWKRGPRLTRCRPRRGGQHLGRSVGRDLEGVQDARERLVATDPARQLHHPRRVVRFQELIEHVAFDAIVL